jgi:predicted DNA-binding transcriptional regulator AlpA
MTAKLANRRPIVRLALSRTEVALSIGVSVTSVDQMVAEGALPPPRKWHSRKLWLVSEVEAYLNEWPSDGEAHEQVNELTAWIAERDRRAENAAPIPSSKDDPIQKHYDQMGFDPLTMDGSEYTRLYREAEDKWRASIPGTPLGKRERKALAQLAEHGVGVPVHWTKIKDCGPDTEERLKARGFLETRGQTKFPDRIDTYILTEAGLNAWEAL